MIINNDYINNHKILFQSITVFPGWILMIYSCFFTIPAIVLFFLSNTFFGADMLLTLAALFILGLFTVREKFYNFIGWGILAIAIGVLIFLIPNGINLIFLFLAIVFIAISSYLGFSYKKNIPKFAYFWAIFLSIIFFSHVIMLSFPGIVGLNYQKNNFSNFFEMAKKEISEMDPVEFSKTDKGREVAIRLYDINLFTSQNEIEDKIKNNPKPMTDFQKSLISHEFAIESNPYNYIFNIYLHSLFELMNEKKL